MDLNQDYFTLFNLRQQFTVDEQQLRSNFRQLQRQVHPDQYAGDGKRQQLLAMRFASYVNTAYQTLKSPLLRAEYLLELAQRPVNSQSMTVADSEFLLLQMQWREKLAETVEAQCKQTLTALRESVSVYREELWSAFDHAYHLEKFDSAKEIVAKLNFVEKMMAEIERTNLI